MFKRPDVNESVYMTYGHIHRVALLGILGAIMGYEGYNSQYLYNIDHKKTPKEYPEFYEKLEGLKVAIEPIAKNGMFPKKVQVFNNSVGYASQEEGGNLVVREYWLENPQWRIYLHADDQEIHTSLLKRLKESTCVYIPYLGKNDHPATIEDVSEIEYVPTDQFSYCHSLFQMEGVQFQESRSRRGVKESLYLYKEQLPVRMTKRPNRYELMTLCTTNQKIASHPDDRIFYQCGDVVLQFIE